jgi:predicted Zn-ribbon and HTH transcriptional regulator
MSLKSISKTHNRSSSPPIFILCDQCYWCATYLDKSRILTDNSCPQCNTDNTELSSFPIMSESFTFDYNHEHGIELEFDSR